MSPKTIAFVHQNIPGQFRNLAPALAVDGHRVFFITRGDNQVGGVTKVQYKVDPKIILPEESQFHFGQRVGRALVHMKETRGVVPDLTIGHVSWGELMYVKDIYPDVPLIGYFEWFQDVRYFAGHPEYPRHADAPFVLRIKNLSNYVVGDTCDAGITPTWWQHSTFPKAMAPKMNVIHDGIDTIVIRRPDQASLALPDGRRLTGDDEVVTYVARGLEIVRGFGTFMRAVAELTRRRPNCHVVIIGEDRVIYGNPQPDGPTYAQRVLSEVSYDKDRIHFLGWTSYATFLDTLYVSSAHVYLTLPFVLSWSMLEAMAAECLVVGSSTPPVQEVIVGGHNGLLVDFDDHAALADTLDAALSRPRDYDPIRREARRTILERYDLHGVCLPRQKALIATLL